MNCAGRRTVDERRPAAQEFAARGREQAGGRRDYHGRGLAARLRARLAVRLATGGAAGLLPCLSPRRSCGQRSHEAKRRDFVCRVSHQKLNRAITSMVRIEPALVTRPNDEEPSVAESPENAGVFVRFWTSQRISR